MPYDAAAMSKRYLTALRAGDRKDRQKATTLIRANGDGCLVLASFSLCSQGASEHEKVTFFSDMKGKEQ